MSTENPGQLLLPIARAAISTALGQPQQHVGGNRALVAFQQGDIGRRNIEIGGHVGLCQAEVAAQAAQARTKIDAAFARHEERSPEDKSYPYNMTEYFCKVLHLNFFAPAQARNRYV